MRWAKLALISAAAVTAIAFLVAAPWRPAPGEICAPLHANIDLVRSGAERRTSDSFVFTNEVQRLPEITVERGDFASHLSLDELRSCLGGDWVETHAQAQDLRTGDAWVFVRSGWPNVLYVRAHDRGYEHARWKIVIERAR